MRVSSYFGWGFLTIALFHLPAAAPSNATPSNATEQTVKLTASDAARTDLFGSAVSIDGSTALVGAPQEEETADAGDDFGAAYIFESDPGNPTSWAQTVKLLPSTPVMTANFGNAVALSGSTALVGAYRENGSVGGAQGAAYLFERDQDGTDNWGQTAKLTPASIEQGDRFGSAVALHGDWALIGAHLDELRTVPRVTTSAGRLP